MIRKIAGLFLLFAAFTVGAAEARWYFDLPEAQALAKKENKLVFIDFTGSDWCGWCVKLKKEVFVTPEFNEYARTNLILVEIDLPRFKPLSLEQLEINGRIQEKYHADGFPTLVVLDTAGQELWRLSGYASLPIPEWLKMLDGLKKTGTAGTPPPIGTLAQASAPAQK